LIAPTFYADMSAIFAITLAMLIITFF
jgi:hypothetical protein